MKHAKLSGASHYESYLSYADTSNTFTVGEHVSKVKGSKTIKTMV